MFSSFRKPYIAVIQWLGKELKILGWMILPILGASLLEPSAEQRGPFKEAILCVKGLIFFNLMVKYRSQTDQTIGYMERYFEDFHRHKEEFARFCAKNSTKESASDLRHKLSKELRTEYEESSDWNCLSNAAKARRIEDDREMIEQNVEQHLTDESDFNFVKMHLPCHFGKIIRQLDHLLNLTSEYYKHEMIDIKDAYRHSNKINATEQILCTKAQREFFRYKNMECEAHLT